MPSSTGEYVLLAYLKSLKLGVKDVKVCCTTDEYMKLAAGLDR